MRKLVVYFSIYVALCSGLVWADMDLSDFDDDLMRSMDTAIKDLEPVIGARNIEAATADVEVLNDGFKQTEDYFAKKGNAEDGVRFSKESQDIAAALTKALAAKDFDGAASRARDMARACTTCHDAYKTKK